MRGQVHTVAMERSALKESVTSQHRNIIPRCRVTGFQGCPIDRPTPTPVGAAARTAVAPPPECDKNFSFLRFGGLSRRMSHEAMSHDLNVSYATKNC